MGDRQDRQRHRLDERDVVVQGSPHNHVSEFTPDQTQVLKSSDGPTRLRLRQAELVLEVGCGALEHVAVKVLAQERLAVLGQRLVGPIPVDDLGQDDDGGQVRLAGFERDVLIPRVRDDVALKVDLANLGDRSR